MGTEGGRRSHSPTRPEPNDTHPNKTRQEIEAGFSLAIGGGGGGRSYGYKSRSSSYSYGGGYGSSYFRASDSGAKLSHSHATQFQYVHQSLRLWREIMRRMFCLWYEADADLLSPHCSYQLLNTGQGLNRVQSCPNGAVVRARTGWGHISYLSMCVCLYVRMPSKEHLPIIHHFPFPACSSGQRDADDPRDGAAGVRRVGGAERGAPGRPRRAQRAHVHRQVHAGELRWGSRSGGGARLSSWGGWSAVDKERTA